MFIVIFVMYRFKPIKQISLCRFLCKHDSLEKVRVRVRARVCVVYNIHAKECDCITHHQGLFCQQN